MNRPRRANQPGRSQRLLCIAISTLALALAWQQDVPCSAQYRMHRPVQNNRQQVRGHYPQQRSDHVARRPARSRPSDNANVNPNVHGISYRLDADDIVSLIIQGVLGDYQSAPIHWPKNGNGIQPGIGYPMPVRDDGTLSLPLLDPINVRGLTVLEAEDLIEQTYIDAGILKGKNLVTCNLMRKRTVGVMVVHNRYPRSLPGQNGQAITKVNLPADNATPLRALAEAGGYFDANNVQVLSGSQSRSAQSHPGGAVRLGQGDIVRAPLPPPAFFYAGGLLNNGRYEIPAGNSISVAQAIAQAGGQVFGRAGFGPSELILNRGNQVRRYNVNALMNHPQGLMIQPGDTISVQQTPGDIFGNIAIEAARFGILGGF